MSIKIYNTLTHRKEVFKPIRKGRVGMYVCGVTVYDDCHIGHLRGAFIFDIVRRYFEYKGYKVKYARNITDVDDKIIERAIKEAEGLTPNHSLRSGSGHGLKAEGIRDKVREVAERYTKSYYEDMKAFGIQKADVEPKATEHIKDMVQLIEKLLIKGYAYVNKGDVYFEVKKFNRYGRLSGQGLEKMEAGARIDIDENKKDPLDFALWKSSKEGEPSWDSPWGNGRPGWHIECSTMSTRYLGENFDIHGGGIDLVFPHHENEIAQSECATGKRFANYWLHNGLLTINSQKMAKSLGNFVTVKDILKKYHPDVLKIFFLSAHYSSPIDFTYEKMEEAKRARERFVILFNRLDSLKVKGLKLKVKNLEIENFKKRFEEAMDDDFNTAGALAVLFDLVTYVNKQFSQPPAPSPKLYYAKAVLLELGRALGLFEKDEKIICDIDLSKRQEIEALINLRQEARVKKDFNEADKIRKRLNEMGVMVDDQKDRTSWRLK